MNANAEIKPKDMGTTGLIQWVISKNGGRRGALAHATARRIIQRRYPSSVEVLARFEKALWMTWDLAHLTPPVGV
jgi:hypothetical protein